MRQHNTIESLGQPYGEEKKERSAILQHFEMSTHFILLTCIKGAAKEKPCQKNRKGLGIQHQRSSVGNGKLANMGYDQHLAHYFFFILFFHGLLLIKS
jgi:hypothetical protein